MIDPITHFKISELPDSNSIISLINGVAVVVDTNYPIADQNLLTFKRTTAFDGLSLSAIAKYKVLNSSKNILSNEALIKLKWNGISATPASVDIDQFIINSQVLNFLSLLSLNDVVEFIEIVTMSGVLNLKKNNIAVQQGEQLSLLDLFYTIYTANTLGGGLPYFTMTYKVGRGITLEPTIYNLKFDLASLATLSFISSSLFSYNDQYDNGGNLETYLVLTETSSIDVDLGSANGIANIAFVITSPFLALNQWNRIIIDAGGVESFYYADSSFNLSLNLNSEGKANIKIKIEAIQDVANVNNSNIDLTLVDINGDVNLVDNLQTHTLISLLP